MAGFGRLLVPLSLENLFNGRNWLLRQDVRLVSFADSKIKKKLEKQLYPTKPKKPATPFLQYMMYQRMKWLEEDPTLTTPQIAKRAAKEWAEADSVLKESLKEKYKREQEEYKEKLALFKRNITDEQRLKFVELQNKTTATSKKAEISKRSEILGKPKKPQSVFFRYMAHVADQKGSTPMVEWIPMVSKMWKNLSPEEKKPFIEQAAQEREQYNKQLVEWEAKMVTEGYTDVVRKSKRRTKEE